MTPNGRMSLVDYQSYLAILSSKSMPRPNPSLPHINQWSFQDSPQILPQHAHESSIEYSAYWSTIDPHEQHSDLDSEDGLSDASSSFDLQDDTKSEQKIDANMLSEYGFKIHKLLSHTINGCTYSAEVIEDDFNDNKSKHHNTIKLPSSPRLAQSMNFKDNSKTKSVVRIKKYEKDNGDAIIQEALICHYLTIKNIPPSPNICQYIDFVETEDAYYLIQEYGEYISLDELIMTAHKFIKQKRLKKKHWRIVVKYLFWQLIATLFWMHHDMKCCVLELNTMNIMVANVQFAEINGMITIDIKNVCVKLCDFGAAELFPLDEKAGCLQCCKQNVISDFFFKDPKVINGEVFNPIKADMYSAGMILFKMFTGRLPYEQQGDTDDGYMALKKNALKQYLKKNKMLKGINKYTMELIAHLLTFDEEQRITTTEVIRNQWFTNYYQRYKKRMQQKSKSQKQRHVRQMNDYKLPYYKLQKKIVKLVYITL
eukprot:71638_1